jgi:hypothetical protein
VTQLGNAQLDRAGAGVAVAIAVTLVAPVGGSFADRGGTERRRLVSEPFSRSSRRAILPSVIVVVPRVRLACRNPPPQRRRGDDRCG